MWGPPVLTGRRPAPGGTLGGDAGLLRLIFLRDRSWKMLCAADRDIPYVAHVTSRTVAGPGDLKYFLTSGPKFFGRKKDAGGPPGDPRKSEKPFFPKYLQDMIGRPPWSGRALPEIAEFFLKASQKKCLTRPSRDANHTHSGKGPVRRGPADGVAAGGPDRGRVSPGACPLKKRGLLRVARSGKGGDRKDQGLFPGPFWGGVEKGRETKVKEEGL